MLKGTHEVTSEERSELCAARAATSVRHRTQREGEPNGGVQPTNSLDQRLCRWLLFSSTACRAKNWVMNALLKRAAQRQRDACGHCRNGHRYDVTLRQRSAAVRGTWCASHTARPALPILRQSTSARPPPRRTPDLRRSGAVMATRPNPRKNHLLAALPAGSGSVGTPRSNRWRCRSARSSTNPAPAEPRLLSNHRHCVAAVCHGKRGVGGNRGGRQRRHCRHIAVHGRRVHARPRGGAKRRCGFRLRAQIVKDEFNRAGAVMHLLLRYTQALITQMAQTAVCNRHHSLDQQLCRWLLLSLDRRQRTGHDPGTDCQHAGSAPRRRDRGGREIAAGWADPLLAWPNLRLGSRQPREAHLRMLRGGEEGIRPAASSQDGAIGRSFDDLTITVGSGQFSRSRWRAFSTTTSAAALSDRSDRGHPSVVSSARRSTA